MGVAMVALSVAPAQAAQVRGKLDPQSVSVSPAKRQLGYVTTRVAAAAPAKNAVFQGAVFLKVKDSLPLEPAKEPLKLVFSGLQFSPAVATCQVDGQVIFRNEDTSAVTIKLAGNKVTTIQPSTEHTYECKAADVKEGGLQIRVGEWAHVRALLFVGETGVATHTQPDGRFSLSAPKGSYDLLIYGSQGLLTRQEVTIEQSDVNLGTIKLEGDKVVDEASK